MKRSELIEGGFVKVKEAAKFLGISESRMYELIHAGTLSHAKHGGRYVVPRNALNEYASARLIVGKVA